MKHYIVLGKQVALKKLLDLHLIYGIVVIMIVEKIILTTNILLNIIHLIYSVVVMLLIFMRV